MGAVRFAASVCGLLVLLSGCFVDKQAEIESSDSPKLLCDRVNGVTIEQPESNELHISASQVARELFPKIDELCSRLDDRYSAIISYESSLDEARSTTKLTSKETKTAIVRIKLQLANEKRSYIYSSVAQLESSGKKVLDIGESVEIDEQDKIMLIQRAAQAVANEVKKVLKDEVQLAQ